MGSTPQMTYKRKESFGTCLGGFFSCFASAFVVTYVSMITLAFFISGRSYDSMSM